MIGSGWLFAVAAEAGHRDNFKGLGRARLAILAASVLGVYLALVSTGFGPYITDDHPFRQAQTAITARYFSGVLDFLEYQTPILGVPWSIPFEFPLYQALAKGLQVSSGLRLETSGRLISVLFFLLCFWPMHILLRTIGVAGTPVVMAAVLLAPLYVFWSRAFMIETTALFFALLFLAVFARMLHDRRNGLGGFIALTAVGVLAALVKITTILPLLLVTMGVNGWKAFGAIRRREPLTGLLSLAVSQGLIVAVALAWVAHTDAIKLLNPLGHLLTSGALRDWNFGPLQQRIDPMIWFALGNATVDMFFPLPRTMAWLKGAQALGWLTLFGYFLRCCAPLRRRQVLVLCGLFLLPFAIFTNLHRIHNYYQAANGWLLCLAFGLAAYGAIETAPDSRAVKRRSGLYAFALLAFAANSFWYLHHKSSHDGQLLDLSALVQQMSSPDSVIVVTGLDWTPILPYQAARRALMLPAWVDFATAQAALKELKNSSQPVSLYVACGRRTARDLQIQEALGLSGSAPARHSDDCDIYPL